MVLPQDRETVVAGLLGFILRHNGVLAAIQALVEFRCPETCWRLGVTRAGPNELTHCVCMDLDPDLMTLTPLHCPI